MAQSKIGWRSYISPIQYTLDKYGSSAAAYSLRKLKVSYSGFAIRVRRSSDNTEQNIGFNTSNDLDTTALTAFVGSGNGFVTTWYDQSGNNKNVIQTTAATQPQIVASGVITTSNGKPAISFTGGRFVSGNVSRANTNEALSMYAVYRLYSTTRQGLFGWGSLDLEPGANSSGIALHMFSNWAYSPNNAAYWSTNLALGSVTFTGGAISNASIYYNGIYRASGITNGGNGNVQAGGTLIVGKSSYSSGSSAISELIFYPNGSQNSNVSLINNDINSYYSIWDNDADAFITAANLSAGQGSSIRTLVATLKTAGIWSKLKAIYPFVGGSANSHKYNLKDPRDLDEAYRLNFYGGWTHYVSGPYGNGSNSYADTNLNPFLKLNTNSSSIGVWVPNGMNNHGFGVWSNSGANKFSIIEQGGGYLKSQMTSSSTEAWGISNTTSGFIMGNRTSATSNKIYRFGSVFTVHPTYGGVPHNTTTNTADYPNANFWLGRVNGNTSISYYNNSLYFAYIADGLTDAEILALSNAAYTFRQSIGYY